MKKKHPVDIASLEIFAENIGSYSRYLIQSFEGKLFHYTDLDAFASIVRNNDLWLTNLRYSNDEHEMTHGYDVAKAVIEKKKKKTRSKKKRAYLDEVAAQVDAPPPEGVYICCFCTEDNLLSQWRGYTDKGSGVSIAFDPQKFARYSGQDLPPEDLGLMRLWKVFYDDGVQMKIVEQALDLIPTLHSRDSDKIKARKAADAIHFFIPTFKNKDFGEEKERRLIFTPSPTCKVGPSYRVARGMLVPYYSLKALGNSAYGTDGPLPITGITIGPSERKELNVDSARMLLEQNGYQNIVVEASDTPFRG